MIKEEEEEEEEEDEEEEEKEKEEVEGETVVTQGCVLHSVREVWDVVVGSASVAW